MSIDQGTETVAVTKSERAWRTNIETPKGGDPVITIFRESVKTDDGGDVITKSPDASTIRAFSAIAADTVTVGGVTVTATQVANFVSAFADKWRRADIENGG